MEKFTNVPDSMEITNNIRFGSEMRSVEATLFGAPVDGQDGTIKLSTGQFGTFHHIDDIMSGLHFEQVVISFGTGQTYIVSWNNDDDIWSCSKNGKKITGRNWYETLAQSVWSNRVGVLN